jgi:hypothetical protein
MQLLRDNLTVRSIGIIKSSIEFFFSFSYGRVMHPIQMKPIHPKNISNCFLISFLFVCVQHTYTQPVINQTDKHKTKTFFFFLLSNITINLRSFFLSLYFYSFVDVNFSFYFFFFCVCVGCNQFFSLAVCSFSFVYSCVVGIVCLM